MDMGISEPTRDDASAEELQELLLADGGDASKGDDVEGDSALLRAARLGDIELATRLLDDGAEVEARNKLGWTALHGAAQGGSVAMMEGLVARGADIHAKTTDGKTALYVAAQNGKLNALTCLIDLGTDVNAVCSEYGFTALLCAAGKGFVGAMRLLASQGANIHAKSKFGSSAAHLSAAQGKLEAVQCALDFGVDVNATNDHGYSPLLIAAEKGNVHIMRLLINHNADVKARSNTGRSVVWCATFSGSSEAIRYAIEAGGDIDAATYEYGSTPLHYASQVGNAIAMRILQSHGANVHALDKKGSSALLIASGNGHGDAVRCAIDFGIDINKGDQDGVSPLCAAAQQGHVTVMKLLFERGANVYCLSKAGSSIVYLASGNGDVEATKTGLDFGVDPNLPRYDGLTPLYFAAERGHVGIMKLLVQRGASPHALTTQSGQSILYTAASNGHVEAVKCALQFKVNVNGTTKTNYTPLLRAAERGHTAVMRLLVEHGANVHAIANNGHGIVFCATVSKKIDALKYALGLGVDVDARTSEGGFTALHRAAENGDVAAMRLLVSHGASVHATSKTGISILQIALNSGKSATAALAMEMGLKLPGIDENGWNPLHNAAKTGNVEMMKLIAARSSGLDALTKDGKSVLHVASLHGRISVMNYAISMGLDVQQGDKKGYTPLHYAALSGDMRVIDLLVKHGAQADAKAKHGASVLHSAVRSKSVEAVGKLIDLGVDVNSADENGYTVLHLSAATGSVPIMEVLISRGASTESLMENGWSILHCAVAKGKLETLRFCLDHYVDANAKAKFAWETPLFLATLIEDHRISHQLAYELCSRGAEWGELESEQLQKGREGEKKSRHNGHWRGGLQACIKHWIDARRSAESPLMQIPLEVVERGADSVRTYISDIAQSDTIELEYRCKVCVIGSGNSGKSSLVQSLKAVKPILSRVACRSAAVQLASSSLVEENTDKPNRRLEMTYWNFSGQEVYQTAQSAFFTRGGLYILVVDLPAYANELANEREMSPDQFEFSMDRYLSTTVFRWIRGVLANQPEARFLFVGTKLDCLEGTKEADRIRKDFQDRLDDWKRSFIQELEQQLRLSPQAHGMIGRSSSSFSDGDENRLERLEDLRDKLAGLSSEWVDVSCADQNSVSEIYAKLQEQIKKFQLGLPVGGKHAQVRNIIARKRSEASESGSDQIRVRQMIVRFSSFCRELVAEIEGIKRSDCEQILRSLHDTGEVLWYDVQNAGELRELVILDPVLGIELVSEIVNHDFSKDALPPPRDGRITHAMLQTFPFWREMNDISWHAFKRLLQLFHLAYPADSDLMMPKSDLVVPAYWKALKRSDPMGTLSRQISKVDYIAKNRWCWEYELSASVSDLVFEQLAVQSSSSYLKRSISANCIESACDEFASRILLVEGEARNDVIRIEVASESPEMSWHNMRFYLMKMEQVLEGYHGLSTWRFVVEKSRGQFMEIRHALDPAVRKLLDAITLGRDEKCVREELPWFPSDMTWFIRKSWKDIGAFQQLQLDQLVRNKLEVLRKLAIAGDAPRRYPALWSLEYKVAEKKVVLRMSSDLSGRCYHWPIEIEALPEFLAKYGSYIKEGLSIVSNIVSNAVSLGLLQNVVDAAISGFDEKVKQTQQIHNLIGKLDMSGPNVFNSRETTLTPGVATTVLRDLLRMNNASFDDLEISSLSNLELAVTETGEYVWAFGREIDMLKGKITRCASRPSTWDVIESPELEPLPSIPSPINAIKDSTSNIKLDTNKLKMVKVNLCIKSVTGLPQSDWHKAYCKWSLFHRSSQAPIASGATGQNTISSAPSWRNIKIYLECVPTVEMLRECRLLVRMKRRAIFGLSRLLGGGEIALSSVINQDALQDPQCDPFDIPIDTARPSKQWVTVQFSFED